MFSCVPQCQFPAPAQLASHPHSHLLPCEESQVLLDFLWNFLDFFCHISLLFIRILKYVCFWTPRSLYKPPATVSVADTKVKTILFSKNGSVSYFKYFIHLLCCIISKTWVYQICKSFHCVWLAFKKDASIFRKDPLRLINSMGSCHEINLLQRACGWYLFPQRSLLGCAETGDYVQLLGGNSIDTSKLLPITDLCISFTGPSKNCSSSVVINSRIEIQCLFLLYPAAHMNIGCENTVVRMVSSGNFVSRVSFSYRLLNNQELQTIKLNNVEDFCFNNWSKQIVTNASLDFKQFQIMLWKATEPLSHCQIQRYWCKIKKYDLSCLFPTVWSFMLIVVAKYNLYVFLCLRNLLFLFMLCMKCIHRRLILLFVILEEEWC